MDYVRFRFNDFFKKKKKCLVDSKPQNLALNSMFLFILRMDKYLQTKLRNISPHVFVNPTVSVCIQTSLSDWSKVVHAVSVKGQGLVTLVSKDSIKQMLIVFHFNI